MITQRPTTTQGLNPPFHYGAIGRRGSDYDANSGAHYSAAGQPENRTLENIKKGHWQSSLGFGGLVDIPQSRRHSFADVPVRQQLIDSTGGSHMGLMKVSRALSGLGDTSARVAQGENSKQTHFCLVQSRAEQHLTNIHLHARHFAAEYFATRNHPAHTSELQRSSNSPALANSNFAASQHSARNLPYAHSQFHHGQILFLVTFKAARGEFYYVQESTGLQIKTGDLVIVEADRGTDLGTVSHANVDWGQAKELKDFYVEEHFKWLMMFSRNNQSGPTGGAINPMALPSRPHGSAVGGMHPQGQSSSQETSSGEIKPKMIKRLAQPHEIQSLRDKEANEAKAKRMCQQKVIEHHLNMEILDAEFQMCVSLRSMSMMAADS